MLNEGFRPIRRYWGNLSRQEITKRCYKNEMAGWQFILMGLLSMFIFNMPHLKVIAKAGIVAFTICMIISVIFFIMSIVDDAVVKLRKHEDFKLKKLFNFLEDVDFFLRKDKSYFTKIELYTEYHAGRAWKTNFQNVIVVDIVSAILLSRYQDIILINLALLVIEICGVISAICYAFCTNRINVILKEITNRETTNETVD